MDTCYMYDKRKGVEELERILDFLEEKGVIDYVDSWAMNFYRIHERGEGILVFWIDETSDSDDDIELDIAKYNSIEAIKDDNIICGELSYNLTRKMVCDNREEAYRY